MAIVFEFFCEYLSFFYQVPICLVLLLYFSICWAGVTMLLLVLKLIYNSLILPIFILYCSGILLECIIFLLILEEIFLPDPGRPSWTHLVQWEHMSLDLISHSIPGKVEHFKYNIICSFFNNWFLFGELQALSYSVNMSLYWWNYQ